MLERCDKIWIIKGFDNDPAYNEKYLKTTIKSYDGKIDTNFHGDKILKEGSHCICLSAISIDSVFRTNQNHHPQVFLEECKFIVKEQKGTKCITDDLEISCDDSDEKNPNRKHSDAETSDEKD